MTSRSSRRTSPLAQRSWNERLVEVGVLFLLVFTPFAYGTVEPWSEAIAELVVLATATIWVLGMLRDWEIRADLPPGWVAGLLFLLLVFLQAASLPHAVIGLVSPWSATLQDSARAYLPGATTAWTTISLAPDATWREALKLAASGLFFVIVYNTCRTPAQVRRAIWTVVITGSAIAVLGLAQRMTWNGHLYWIGPEAPHRQAFGPHAFGPFVNRAHFAALATVVIALAVAVVMSDGMSRPRRAARALVPRLGELLGRPSGSMLVLTALLGAAVLIAGSRGGIVGLAVTFLILAVLSACEKPTERSASVVGLVGGVTLLAGAWLGVEILMHTAGRLASEAATLDESMRVLRWVDAARMINAAPILGTGLASFEDAFPVFRTVAYPARFTHAESDWIQLASDTGMVGAMLVVLAVGQVLWAGVCAWRSSALPADRALRIGALAALAGLIVQGAANYTLPVMSNQLYAALAAGILVAGTRRTGSS